MRCDDIKTGGEAPLWLALGGRKEGKALVPAPDTVPSPKKGTKTNSKMKTVPLAAKLPHCMVPLTSGNNAIYIIAWAMDLVYL
uniref:Uncharacterized protein n=1 Tax=Panagrellus redivivus TaxID=6233 RepID=A0A7E4ZXB3_PANRE